MRQARRASHRAEEPIEMHYRKLGRWGVKVSAVSLGSWLTYGGSVEEDTSRACIQRAYELGVNFFDTANAYGRGRAEEVVGSTLAQFRRESYVLGTKVFFPMSRRPNDSGLSRKHVLEQCHASLRRLGVDYIDLYQCHRYDPDTPLEETSLAMDDLTRQGKVLYWGVSEWSAQQLREVVQLCREQGLHVPVSDQPQYSALYRRIEADVLPACFELGLGILAWSPLAGGVLTGKYRSPEAVPPDSRAAGSNAEFVRHWMRSEVLDAVQALRPVADAAGCTLTQLALAWVLRKSTVASCIVGATKPQHLDESCAAADLELPDETLDAVTEILGPVAER